MRFILDIFEDLQTPKMDSAQNLQEDIPLEIKEISKFSYSYNSPTQEDSITYAL